MPTIDPDWTPPAPRVSPGVYHAEIASAEVEHRDNGNSFIVVKWAAVENGTYLTTDRLMFRGKNDVARGMAIQRLKALGYENGKIETEMMLGKRAYVALCHEEYNGLPRVAVDIRAKGSMCGYWSEKNQPDTRIETPGSEESVPF